jgi:hypothetical protein
MSELSSISDSPDVKTPSPISKSKQKAKKPKKAEESKSDLGGWEGLNDEEMFKGTTKSPIGGSTLFSIPASFSQRFTFGENLSISSTSYQQVLPVRIVPELTLHKETWVSILPRQLVCTVITTSAYEVLPEAKPRRQFACKVVTLPVISFIQPSLRARRTVIVNSDRRDLVEEYFTLMTQAVKLNSSNVDSLSKISTSDLYRMAQSQSVPFNKWYGWIKAKITPA